MFILSSVGCVGRDVEINCGVLFVLFVLVGAKRPSQVLEYICIG